MGGDFARTKVSSLHSIYGAYFLGLFKCLSIEHRHCKFKAVDLDASIDSHFNAKNIMEEIKYEGRLEVGYINNKRIVFNVKEVPFHLTYEKRTTENLIILVFGGARGITAECLKHIQDTECTLIIIGRSFEIDSHKEFANYNNFEELRKALIDHYKGDKIPSPAEINRECSNILRQKEINDNINILTNSRVTIEYKTADVTKLDDLESIVKDTYSQYGRIDGIIHAAGILKDKLFLDQNIDAFRQVYKTKVTLLEAIYRYIDIKNLSLLIFFSSVAGRFGNVGQSDYASANETISRFACYAKHLNTNLCVNSICWGPWDTTGMANESVKERFRQQKIIPIPLHSGVLMFEKAFLGGYINTVEVIAGKGPWVGYETHDTEKCLTSTIDQSSRLPFIESEIDYEPTGSVSYYFKIDKSNHIFLNDHKIDANPVIPATGAMELMAELVQKAWPDWIVTEVRSLRVLKGIVIESELMSKSIKVRAKPSTHAYANEFSVSASIVDNTTNQVYYSATVILGNSFPDSSNENFNSEKLLFNVNASDLYKNSLFHGPLFQLIEQTTEATTSGISSIVKGSTIQDWFSVIKQDQSWIFDPGLLDTGPQLAIVWARKMHNTTPLPSQFDSVIRYRKTSSSETFISILKIKDFDGINMTYDVFYYAENGELVIKMNGLKGTCIASLNRLSSQ